MITSTPILKRDSTGRLRTWFYEVDADKYRTTAGGPGRKPVTSAWRACKGKQGRSDVQQALFEADADERSKLDREYRRTEAELASVPPSPMLAHKYEDHVAGLKYPVFCQPKLDGIRAFVTRHGAFSREYQRHLNVDHILEALAPVFKISPSIVFDGELYNHDLKEDFGKIASVVRKQNPTASQRDEARALIQYHIYDIMYDITDNATPFGDRAQFMFMYGRALSSPALRIVHTAKVTSPDKLDEFYGAYLEAGYEGQMVRTDTPYEFDKRSKSLLKRKEFITAEFKLLRIEEGQGNWAGYAKRAVFQLADGRECGAGIRGTQSEMKDLLTYSTPATIAATQVTVRYFTPTPDGMPRFPVAIDFHLNGRKD